MKEPRWKTLTAMNEGKEHVIVRETTDTLPPVRQLLVNNVRESAAYVSAERKNELVFTYMKSFARIFDALAPAAKETLLFGGAGFSFPRFYISRYPDKRMDVVEIRRYMFDLAVRYFFLDDLYEEYALNVSRRLQIFIEDANDFLKKNRAQYDVIINDAYVGNVPDQGLLSDKSARLIRGALRFGGFYIVNLITAPTGYHSMPGVMAQAVLKIHLKNIHVSTSCRLFFSVMS